MTAVAAAKRVAAPLSRAERYVKAFFAKHRCGDSACARIALHAGEIARSVRVSLEPVRRPGETTPRFSVHWEADPSGPYPAFDGELAIGGDRRDGFWILLVGGYEPPFGFAGKLFDAILGQRVAESTAYGLLDDIRCGVETQYAAEAVVAAV